MQACLFRCPLCLFEADLSTFPNMNDGMLKCRRCRGIFKDPSAYSSDYSYADCDSISVVYRFPFLLNKKQSIVRVRDNYLAIMIHDDGKTTWITNSDTSAVDRPGNFRLYYICLTPKLTWGSQSIKEFGAYGTAQVLLDRNYVIDYCKGEGQILTLEEHLKGILNRYLTGFIENELRHNHAALLEHRDGYTIALGKVREGIILQRIFPMGFRNAKNQAFTIANLSEYKRVIGAPEKTLQPAKAPVLQANVPRASYTVKGRTEEVFVCSNGKMERHKAGEIIDPKKLHGISIILRYQKKEFEFPCGWGMYNQSSIDGRLFSANGSIVFIIDSTEKLSSLYIKTKNWGDFEEKFYNSILRQEIVIAMKAVLNRYLEKASMTDEAIRNNLSTMSIELVNQLNGEIIPPKKPSFQVCGLRVKQIDIMDLCLYSNRR